MRTRIADFPAVARYGIGDADVVRRLVAAIEAVAARAPDERATLQELSRAIRAEARTRAAAFEVADLDASASPRAQGQDRSD